jgi:preprotein translocase subunit SecF
VPDLFREKKWDLVGRRGLWFAIMAISILICIGALVFRTQSKGSALNYGIDFTGGGIVTFGVSPAVPIADEATKTEQIRTALEKSGAKFGVQLSSTTIGRPRDQVIVRTQMPKGQDEEKVLDEQIATIKTTLESLGFNAGDKPLSKDRVSGVVSKELTQRATLALIFGCLAIIVWIFIRYDFGQSLVPKFGLCAIFALFHDLIILTGAFSIVWWVVDSPFVAAFLTILGYSVHDTIVIFDRIRENVKLRKRPTFAETVNLSLLETMARSVNTVLTVEFVLVCLYAFGGTTLRGFAGALIIGITSGAWSSIFIASQLLVSWKKREEKGKLATAPVRSSAQASAKKATVAPKPVPKPSGAIVTPSVSTAATDDAEGEEPTADGTSRTSSSAKKLKGKKRHRRF